MSAALVKTDLLPLNALVTQASFGISRTASEELEVLRADQLKLHDVVTRLQASAFQAGDHRFNKLPRWPLSALLEFLAENFDLKSQPARDLVDLARTLVDHQHRYAATYQQALDEIFFSSAKGETLWFGRTAVHRSAPYRFIEPTYFLGAVTIGHTRTDVGPTAYLHNNRPLAGSILKSGPDLLPIFFDVAVQEFKRSSFKAKPTIAFGTPPPEHAVEQWYRERLNTLSSRPTREEDETAIRTAFPDLPKKRQTVRCLRHKFLNAPRGRRRSK